MLGADTVFVVVARRACVASETNGRAGRRGMGSAAVELKGELEPEGRAFALLADDAESTAREANNVPYKREAEPGPLASLLATDLGLDIGREEARVSEVGLIDTRTGVLNLESDDDAVSFFLAAELVELGRERRRFAVHGAEARDRIDEFGPMGGKT